MADLGAIGTSQAQLSICALDIAIAQNITINPIVAIIPAAYVALPYRENWKSVSGTVRDSTGAGAVRTTYLFRRSTGELVAAGQSVASGAYALQTPYADEHVRLVLDDVAGTLYNDIVDRVIPG